MRLDKLAITAQEAVQASQSMAADMLAAQIEPEHLLKVLLDANEGNLNAIIERIEGAAPPSAKKRQEKAEEGLKENLTPAE